MQNANESKEQREKLKWLAVGVAMDRLRGDHKEEAK